MTAIIRSAGERTEGRCFALVSEQMNGLKVFLVREKPFERALRTTYDIAIKAGSDWTITIDADVLIGSSAISSIIEIVNGVHDDVFEVHFTLLDKFMGIPRPVGLRAYRTSLLAKAIDLIPEPGESIRPESHVVQSMARMGHKIVLSSIVLGIHDYDQYYKDIYRKCVVHAHKHNRVLGLMAQFWRQMSAVDKDYAVALCGLRDGLTQADGVVIDIDRYCGDVKKLNCPGVSIEKSLIPDNDAMPVELDTLLARMSSLPHYAKMIPYFDTSSVSPPMSARIRSVTKRIGWIRFIPWVTGRVLERFGSVISRLADPS